MVSPSLLVLPLVVLYLKVSYVQWFMLLMGCCYGVKNVGNSTLTVFQL